MTGLGPVTHGLPSWFNKVVGSRAKPGYDTGADYGAQLIMTRNLFR
jgi:hypothetical protein